MRMMARSMLCAALLCAAPCVASPAQADVSLARIARESGLTYAWLGVERAVSLARPGLVIVVRPGSHEVEVNDRIVLATNAPRYVSGDLYISPALARRIEALARAAAAAAPQPAAAAPRQAAVPPVPTVAQASSGAISLEARPLAGSEAIVVNGQAPAGAPVTITLFGTLSSDVPTVVVSRHDVQTDVDGRFQAVIPIAPDYFRNSILEVVATSVPGVSSASAELLVGPPNGGVAVPVETMPHEIW